MTEIIQTSELSIEVAEGLIYVKSWTPPLSGSQIPIILLHDSLGCVEMWKDFPQNLCRRTARKVIAYDRLGFGKSSPRSKLPSKDFVSEEAEVYLPLVLRALALERFSLFGHSVGGGMAIAAAALFQDQCQSLVTESAQVYVEEQTRNGIMRAKSDFQNPDNFAKLQKYHGSKTRWVLDAWIEVWLSSAFASWSLRDTLPKVKCTTLVIHGHEDEYGSLRFPNMIAQYVSGEAELRTIADCGHVPHREKASLVLDLLSDFFGRH